jgi:hypothetical protein
MKTLFVQLGRSGDIINALPMFQREAGEGKADVLVSSEFAPLFDGVSYVNPIITDLHYTAMNEAIAWANGQRRWDRVIPTQIYGKNYPMPSMCSSFAFESWNRFPDPLPWGSKCPVFDRRDTEREKALIASIPRKTKKPKIVTTLSGFSHALKDGPAIFAGLKERLSSRFELIDLSLPSVSGGQPIKLERIYDLLGVLERAAFLVSMDTFALHLAASCSLRCITIHDDSQIAWNSSPWRPTHLGRFYASEALDKIGEMADILCNPHPTPILHVWADWRESELDAETKRRLDFAQSTWVEEGMETGYMQRNFKKESSVRNSKAIGDVREMPFIRDIIDYSMAQNPSDDTVIFLSNSDVCFVPGLTGLVLDACRHKGACFTHRWDFNRLTKKMVNQAQCATGAWYPGSDFFAFRVDWWKKHGNEFPDMVIGCECWDLVMRNVIRINGGIELERVIYHEKHPSFWERPENFNSNPGNLHNRRLSRSFFDANASRGANAYDWQPKFEQVSLKRSWRDGPVRMSPAISR